MLPRGQRIDLLTCLQKTAIVLLLELGADIVEGHQGRGAFEVCIQLFTRRLSVRVPTTQQAWKPAPGISLTSEVEVPMRGVPGVDVPVEPECEPGVFARIRRPYLSSFGWPGSADQERVSDDGRCCDCGTWSALDGADVAATVLETERVVLAETMAAAASGS